MNIQTIIAVNEMITDTIGFVFIPRFHKIIWY